MKAISTKYLPQTATLPRRMTAWDQDGNRATISLDMVDDSLKELDPNGQLFGLETEYRRHVFMAHALRRKMGWTGKLAGGTIKVSNELHMVFVFV